MATDHGGHLGFIGRSPKRLWADEVIMEWIAGVAVKNPRFESSRV
jgi:predicted alpha/beta-fold hydrolase